MQDWLLNRHWVAARALEQQRCGCNDHSIDIQGDEIVAIYVKRVCARTTRHATTGSEKTQVGSRPDGRNVEGRGIDGSLVNKYEGLRADGGNND